MWTKKLLPLVLAILPSLAGAQIVAMTDTVDFGRIREADGPATVRLYVKNTGDSVTSILKVRPTCGCTAADFQKEEMAPGDSAWIMLTYDPVRRPGRFEKGVKIYPSAGRVLRVPITGTVFATPATIDNMFPVDAGLLHLSESTLMTLSPLDERNRTLYIDVYNSGDKPVWYALRQSDDAIDNETFNNPVLPGDKAMIGIYINPAKEKRSGALEYRLQLLMTENPEKGESLFKGSEPVSETESFEIRVLSEK